MSDILVSNDYLSVIASRVNSALSLPDGERLIGLRIDRGFDERGDYAARDDVIAEMQSVQTKTPGFTPEQEETWGRREPRIETWDVPFCRHETCPADPSRITALIQRALNARWKFAEEVVTRLSEGKGPLPGLGT